jgi:nucleotide-binding universal stress UspA family protein
MFRLVMAPVDLAHADRLERALRVTGDIARHYGAPVCYVAVGSALPGRLGHTPAEFATRLAEFGRSQAEAHGIEVRTHPVISHDPVSDVDDALIRTAREIGADLVVMASHIPDVTDRFWPSNAGKILSHTGVSVFVVREG